VRRLFNAFRSEQQDPDRFYRLLAQDTVALISSFTNLAGSRVLDVGSGPGDLAEAFREAGAHAVALDVDWEEMHCRERTWELAVLGDGARLPLAEATFDLGCASNVFEHLANPFVALAELARVVRPGGMVFVNFTTWLSPWGGHETSPWHVLGGAKAARRYTRRHGHPPKNRFGETLFALGVGEFLTGARQVEELRLESAFPRYFPRWSAPLVHVPGVREIATWNLATVFRRC
jgi:SAM-dependent methyltransferase